MAVYDIGYLPSFDCHRKLCQVEGQNNIYHAELNLKTNTVLIGDVMVDGGDIELLSNTENSLANVRFVDPNMLSKYKEYSEKMQGMMITESGDTPFRERPVRTYQAENFFIEICKLKDSKGSIIDDSKSHAIVICDSNRTPVYKTRINSDIGYSLSTAQYYAGKISFKKWTIKKAIDSIAQSELSLCVGTLGYYFNPIKHTSPIPALVMNMKSDYIAIKELDENLQLKPDGFKLKGIERFMFKYSEALEERVEEQNLEGTTRH